MGLGTPPHNLLSALHPDTLVDTAVRGDLLYVNSTPKWARLPKPSVLSELSHDGTDVSWVTATGTGAPARATSPVFVTPTLGVASATKLTVDAGNVGAPSISVGGLGVGIYSAANGYIAFTDGSTIRAGIDAATTFTLYTGTRLGFDASNGNGDLYLVRAAAATLQMGVNINGAAISQSLQAANGVTGTDKTGGNFTLSSGKGTGAGPVSSIFLQTPTVLASGTTAQSLTTRVTVDANGIKATGYLSSDGSAGVTAGPYTVITSITVKNGLITALAGS